LVSNLQFASTCGTFQTCVCFWRFLPLCKLQDCHLLLGQAPGQMLIFHGLSVFNIAWWCEHLI
jgi:hypothetical protein